MARLELVGLCKAFIDDAGRSATALDDFSLSVPDGEFAVLLGPSGCGKSTVLNSVAGLVQPDGGSIMIGERCVFDAGGRGRSKHVPPDRRDLGMVFQSYALWPHMSVFDNVAFPLRSRRASRDSVRDRVLAALDVVQCSNLPDRYPGELSGGQQQRIALARAVVDEPDVVLFDEPLSNLDANLRSELRDELALLHQRIGFTALYVTHDQAEALSLGTFVAVMRAGRIEQADDPETLYDEPATPYVAGFFGSNCVSGRVTERRAGSVTVGTPFGAFVANGDPVSDEVVIAVHPHRLDILETDASPVTVRLSRFAGTRYEFHIAGPDDSEIRAFRPSRHGPIPLGTPVTLTAAPEDITIHTTATNTTAPTAPENELPSDGTDRNDLAFAGIVPSSAPVPSNESDPQ